MSKKRQRWSKELIIERIRERHWKGLSLSLRNVRRDDGALYHAACKHHHFSSWKAAVKMSGVSYDDARKVPAPYWSKELIIEQIHGRYSEGLSLNAWGVQRDNLPLFQAACSTLYFGSWEAAIEASGLSYQNVRKNEAWSKEIIIERIRRRHDERLPLSFSNVRQDDPALLATASSSLYFGSWKAAIEAAGLDYEDICKRRRWSREIIGGHIRTRCRTGLSLSAGDVQSDDPVLFAASVYHFGSWEAAVEAAGLSYPRVCKVRRTKDLSRSSKSEDRVTFLQNLGSRKKSRERNPREEKRG